MNKILIGICVTSLSLVAFGSLANDTHRQNNEIQKNYMSRGEVVEVETDLCNIKLSHEPFLELGWLSMTIYFKVVDKTILDAIKTGDQIKFEFVEN